VQNCKSRVREVQNRNPAPSEVGLTRASESDTHIILSIVRTVK